MVFDIWQFFGKWWGNLSKFCSVFGILPSSQRRHTIISWKTSTCYNIDRIKIISKLIPCRTKMVLLLLFYAWSHNCLKSILLRLAVLATCWLCFPFLLQQLYQEERHLNWKNICSYCRWFRTLNFIHTTRNWYCLCDYRYNFWVSFCRKSIIN